MVSSAEEQNQEALACQGEPHRVEFASWVLLNPFLPRTVQQAEVRMTSTPDPAAIVQELLHADAGNRYDQAPFGRLFDPPALVAVAGADDPWFVRFKQVIGEFHWTPREALKLTAPLSTARSVICFSLRVAQPARLANRGEKQIPARYWAYMRTYGEEIVTRLRHGLAARLRQHGFAAVAPAVAPQNKVERYPGVGLSSCWSERHVAFVAGLGTFGLSGALITAHGIAHRLGSVVTDARLEPTARPYGDDPFAWCLRNSRNTCGACIRRCPGGAVGETMAQRDKLACEKYQGAHIAGPGPALFGWEGIYGCGLCQTGVPCEDRNPTA